MEKRKVALISCWYFPKGFGIRYSMHSLAKTRDVHVHEVSVIIKSYSGTPKYTIIDWVSVMDQK